jgi:hypothetical protein
LVERTASATIAATIRIASPKCVISVTGRA